MFKRIIIGLVVVLTISVISWLVQYPGVVTATTTYMFGARAAPGGASGAGPIDDIPDASITDEDMCFLVDHANLRFLAYSWLDDSASAESYPDVVKPDDSGDGGRWHQCALCTKTGTDPDVGLIGEFTHDTDGANETGDESLRGYDGSNQFCWARKLKCIHATVIAPNDLADGTRDACPIWSNETGMTFTITKIEAWSDTDDTELNVEEEDADGANNTTVDALNIQTDGTGMYYTTETTITGATIEANHIILLDFDDTDDPGWVKVSICGWFDSNVD